MGVSQDSLAVIVGVIGGQLATSYMQSHVPGMSRVPNMWLQVLLGVISFYFGESQGQDFMSNVGLGMFANGFRAYLTSIRII